MAARNHSSRVALSGGAAGFEIQGEPTGFCIEIGEETCSRARDVHTGRTRPEGRKRSSVRRISDANAPWAHKCRLGNQVSSRNGVLLGGAYGHGE